MRLVLGAVLLALSFTVSAAAQAPVSSAAPVASAPKQLGHGYDFVGNGKRPGPAQKEVWRRDHAAPVGALANADVAKDAARHNLAALERARKAYKIKCGNITVTGAQLLKTGQIVADALAKGHDLTSVGLQIYRCRGEDNQGNLHFTGYYTPRLQATKTRDARFRFPIYQLPTGLPKPWPTREQIDVHNALASRGLELAYVDDLLDLYFVHVQGSSQLQWADGTIQRIAYAGSNGHPYKSLGKYLVSRGSIAPEAISLRAIRQWFDTHPEELVPLLHLNPSYVFFKPTNEETRGAANVDLVAGCSVAADLEYFPQGSCLLAEVPRLDEAGKLQGYDLRVLFVHDIGGAIRGSGHLDLYQGIGREQGMKAGDLHHYGRVWLLLADGGPVSR